MKKEIWKDIPNYEGIYQVSNYGRVKSLKRYTKTYNGHKECLKLINEKILKSSLTKNGYLHISLSNNGKHKTFLVHLLVIRTFIGNSTLYTDHLDCNKTNNKLSNLEYVTPQENTIRAWKNNLAKPKENKINQYDLDGKFIKTWYNAGKIESILKIDHSNIIKCCRGKRNNAGGYIWKYCIEQ